MGARRLGLLGAVLIFGCPKGDETGAGAESGSGGIGLSTGGTASSAGDTGVSADTGGSSAGASSVGDSGGVGSACGNETLACSDGMDNDGDGKVDGLDPECTGVCDDDEGSFQTGIPGDNVDCKQDCFFDGNSGQGDDGCVWNLRCDPENPGENVGCEYTGNGCGDEVQTQQCIDYCSGLTPNGCDCFGCCTVEGPDGPVNIFLNSGPDCRIDNLEGCSSCTPSTDCGNDCNDADCELCFGEDELPEGCEEPSCAEGQTTCQDGAACDAGYVCVTGCCVIYTPQG